MTSRERVRAALDHEQPDVTPCDYFATPEIHQALLAHFRVSSDDELVDRLGTDIRYISPPYTGPELATYEDGSSVNIWGVRRKPMPNEYGDYAEPVDFPYAAWTTVEEAAAFPWPSADHYDYDAVPALCARYPHAAVAAGSFAVQDFINSTAFGRGVEQVLLDIATEDPVYLFIVERRHRFYLEHIDRILTAARGRIDLVLCGDDFGSQRGPLISPSAFDRLFAPRKKELFDLVHAHGAKVTHHCCGSSLRRSDLLPRRRGRPGLAPALESGGDPLGGPPADGRSGPRRRLPAGTLPQPAAGHSDRERARALRGGRRTKGRTVAAERSPVTILAARLRSRAGFPSPARE
jgi:uroporphyrinogen decarboxylase